MAQKKSPSFIERLPIGVAGRLILIGFLIGTVSGLGAAGFFISLEWVSHFAFDTLAHAPMSAPAGEEIFHASHAGEEPIRWIFFILPIIGGLISGFLVYQFAPEAEGHGTDAMIDAFHNKAGFIRTRVPFIKSVATIATLGLGGSAGREGPIAQIGAGFGSWIATKLGLSARERRIMLLAGCAGGLGSIFRSPLGGALTSIEVLYSEDFETEALIPSIISSVTGYAIFTSIFGNRPIFDIPYFTWSPVELIFYTILGLICVPVGIFYIKVFYGMRDYVFRKIKLPRFLLPALGGLGVALLGLLIPEVYGGGWGIMQDALHGDVALKLMLYIVLAKILATSFTIGSGGSGGVFGPTLFIGGMLGGVVGLAAHQLFPGSIYNPGAFVLVGMASFFAGVANAPIGALIMVSEMTGGYKLLAPLMIVSALAILFSRRYSIYEKQVKDKFASPAHIGDLTINVLEEMKVEDCYHHDKKLTILPNNMTFGQFRKLITSTDLNQFPIADSEGRLEGVVAIKATRQGIFNHSLDDLVLLSDVATRLYTVKLEDDLYTALILFLKTNYTTLYVTDPEDENRLIGVIHHDDLIQKYYEEVARRKDDQDD